MESILQNIKIIKQRIATACTRVGWKPEEVELLLATKTVTPEHIKIALKAENALIAENEIQELREKYEALKDVPHTNHFIGHLQANKIKEILRCEVSCVGPADRIDLTQKLHNRLASGGKELDISIQVNTSGKGSKFGADPAEVLDLVKQVAQLPILHIRGLMTIGLFSAKTEKAHACFKLLRRLQQEIIALGLPNVDPQEPSTEMSDDLKAAIEEGATVVHIRTAIFGQRIHPDSYYWSEGRQPDYLFAI